MVELSFESLHYIGVLNVVLALLCSCYIFGISLKGDIRERYDASERLLECGSKLPLYVLVALQQLRAFASFACLAEGEEVTDCGSQESFALTFVFGVPLSIGVVRLAEWSTKEQSSLDRWDELRPSVGGARRIFTALVIAQLLHFAWVLDS